MRIGICVFVGILLASCATTTPKSSNDSLDRLCNDYWESNMREYPTWATDIGDHRYDDRLTDNSPAGRERRLNAAKEFLARLNAVPSDALAEKDSVTCDILKRNLEFEIEGQSYATYEFDVDQLGGPQVWIFELMNNQPLKTEAEFRKYIARLKQYPQSMKNHITDLRAGMAKGRTAFKKAVERTIGQVEKQINTPTEQNPIMDALKKLETPNESLKKELFEVVETCILPPLKEYYRFLDVEYTPRGGAGMCNMADGLKLYEFRIRQETTTEMTAEEIHKIGLGELEKYQRKMMEIARRSGHEGDLESFIQKVMKDPKSYFSSREEIVGTHSRTIAQIYERLPKIFKKLPKCMVEVKPLEDYKEKDAPAAYYYGPDRDFKRKGIFYVNTYKPEMRPKFSAISLAAHEAIPGHHMQIATSMEIEGLPEFRKQGGFTAYVEGWALYAEELCDELGLYKDDLSKFGYLTDQAWRAARLVVDTGIHAFNWTREQAIDFFKKNLAIPEDEITNEIDRYIIWPGQALAYMTGKREIQALREAAHAVLGDRFDIREFHDVVLRNGAVPLPTLRNLVHHWVHE